MEVNPGFLFQRIIIAQRLTMTKPRNKMKADSGGNSSNSLPVVAPQSMERTPVNIPIFQRAAARRGNSGPRKVTPLNRDNSQIPVPIPAHVDHP
jgi:hypothetical protein